MGRYGRRFASLQWMRTERVWPVAGGHPEICKLSELFPYCGWARSCTLTNEAAFCNACPDRFGFSFSAKRITWTEEAEKNLNEKPHESGRNLHARARNLIKSVGVCDAKARVINFRPHAARREARASV